MNVLQLIGVLASLAAALGGLGLGVAGFVRSGRAEDAQLRSNASEVGLKMLETALESLRGEVGRLTATCGELRGQLDECLRQREHQERELIAQAKELAEFKGRMS